MRLGISSYCLFASMTAGTMNIYDVMDWAKAHQSEHFELVPFLLDFLLEDGSINLKLVEGIREHAQKINLPLSTFSLNANVLKETQAERRDEIARIKKYIDIAHMLGLSKMRHDTVAFSRPFDQCTPEAFEEVFPILVDSSQECADYAAQYGMNTTLENHGFFANGADRVIRLLNAIDRPNVRMTMDVGNFLCVDDSSEMAVKKCVGYADMIHLKDFYIRDKRRMPAAGARFNCDFGNWFETIGGRVIRGAILGQGDLDIWDILGTIKNSGYDGDISIEFEGMEPCENATAICLDTARTIWEQV